MKRIVAFFLCVLLLCMPACSRKKKGFDYLTSDILSDYYSLSLAEITGGSYAIDLPTPMTEEEARRELRRMQLVHSSYDDPETAIDCYKNMPAYGDQAMIYYDVRLSENGESVLSNIFAESGALGVYIGYWEFPQFINDYNILFHSEKFSDALQQTMPSARTFGGNVVSGDIIVIDVDCMNASGGLEKGYSEVRIDTASLSLYESFLPTELLSTLVGRELGKEFSVSRTYVPTGASDPVTLTYNCVVTHKVTEEYRCVTVDVPAGNFSTEYSEALQSLNGKTAYVYYTIARYVDFAVPALDRSFLVDTLGLSTDETDPDLLVAAAIKQILYQNEQKQLYNEICSRVTDVILDKLLATDRVIKYPESVLDAEYEALVNEVTKAYEKDRAKAEAEGKTFAYSNIDAYAAYYYSYDPALYGSMKAFCEDEAKYQIKLRLTIFAMAQAAGIRYTEEKADEIFAVYMEQQIKSFTDQGVSLTEEERRMIYGSATASNGSKIYQEFVRLAIKFYATYQSVNLTQEDIASQFGTEADLRFRAVFRVAQMEVMEYVYRNNTWQDTTP